ncbi:MAG: serine/threonine protein kinase [Thermoanaerobaculia bacterium]|nr:serine/threonine protein kinase [Thermoanaerobaculia bacterium]MBP9824087.1 serine/threonine protein kinase [Thermoanaerobaculia bacterium]
MTGDPRLRDLYLEAVELDDVAREELLGRLRAAEPALAAALARLLARPESEASPIDRLPALGAPSRDPATVPTRVGPYRILREIGRGGMGRVFLAEQETPDFRRTVALKLIDRHAEDDEAVRRFRDEVRILAALDHPGIARFLDGGRSPEGIWFLALEYVEGVDLLSHARQLKLDIPARVRLFLAVVDAVAFAHERGVVHRDLKPGNVLVGRDGSPRLLDFGISKLLDPEEGAGLTTTRQAGRPLTPAYASPEQLEGGAVTTASDSYSLAVMLYELLTGARPSTTSARSGTAPEPPSALVRRASSSAQEGSTTARRSPARRLRRRPISRDLDAICLFALRADPAARYPGAAELAADLRRYLEGSPVMARLRSGRSPTRELLARHRTAAVLTAALLLAALLFGLSSLLRVQADGAVRTALRARSFPLDATRLPTLEDAQRRWSEAPSDTAAGAVVAMVLVEQRRFEEARFAIQRIRQIPGRELDPLADYAEAASAVALGEHQRALVLFTRGLETAVREQRSDLVGGLRLARGTTLLRLGERTAARSELEAACGELERAGDHKTLVRAWNAVALEDLRRGDLAASQQAFEEALAAAGRAGSRALVTRSNFAQLDLLRGRPDLAEAKLAEIAEARRREPNPVREGQARLQLAIALRDLGRAEEAAAALDRAIALLRTAGAEPSLGAALHERALAALAGGRLSEVDALAAELEAISSTTLNRRPLGFASTLRARSAALTADLAAARAGFAEARRLLLANGDLDLAAASDLAWVECEWHAGDLVEAERILAEALRPLEHPEATLPGFFGALLQIRLDLAAGRSAEGARRLAHLGNSWATSSSVGRRLSFLAARAALAASERRPVEAATDLDAAVALAAVSRNRVAELELRLELAAVRPRPGVVDGIEREARALGLLALAEQARRAGAERSLP